ncbi:hypothetical protein DMUE_2313 [Dictyocoela muelleri]|nr:hypothetical protein DMUE_2313 [Dictyocoela muelleri]
MLFVDLLKQKIKEDLFIAAQTAFTDVVSILSMAYRYNPSLLRHFSTFSSLKSIIYRIKREFYPSSHTNLIENLDHSLFFLPDGGDMLIFHEAVNDPMLILGDKRFINNFCNLNNLKIYMDGTFKAEPNEFFQLYIIHAEFNTQCFPILYCFLMGKQKKHIL